MKNRFLIGLVCISILLSAAGCKNKENNSVKDENTNKNETTQTVKSKCSYYKCLSMMTLDNTMDELDEIVGFKAESVDVTTENMTRYEYDFGNDKKITVTLYKDKLSTIKIEYDKKDLKNKKVTLENLSDIKARINDGISYDEFKEAVGGVDGTLIEVSSWNKYVWVAEDGSSNVTASFGKDGNLKFFSGLGFK